MKDCIICGQSRNENQFVGLFCKECFDSIRECRECGNDFDVNFKQDGEFYCESCFFKKHNIEMKQTTYYVYCQNGDYVGNSNENGVSEVLEACGVENVEYSEYGFDFEKEGDRE